MIKDIEGRVFSFLTALAYAGSNKYGSALWNCVCQCGGNKVVLGAELRSGKVKSCGCLAKRFMGEARQLASGTAILRFIYRSYRKSAQERGLAFDLSLEDFTSLTKLPCTYCGAPPSQTLSKPDLNGSYTYSGIDRQDNTQGYAKENAVPCCSVCNYAKRAMSVQQYLDHCRKVALHTQGGRRTSEIVVWEVA